MISAVIVCGGSSARMKGIDKMTLLLEGMPVWERTLQVFLSSSTISEIVLVSSAALLPQMQERCGKYPKVKAVVLGGSTRQQSVLAGVAMCDPNTGLIAVHDGARPFVSEELIERVIADAECYGAAAPAVPVKDTIKVRNQDGFTQSTLDRSSLVACQTPQIFEAKLYRAAAKAAEQAGKDYTDDCQLIEAYDKKVYLSLGSYDNIKLTTPEDIKMAEFLGKRES